MYLEQFKKGILTQFKWEPTQDQAQALDALLAFLLAGNEQELFVLKGYAGTGKTSLMSALIQFLNQHGQACCLMAPTGRAAKVFSSYSRLNASTIHKKIYRQRVVDGSYGGFALSDNLHHHTLFFVDEASMISNSSDEVSEFGSGRLLDDLIRYVYNGNHCRLILMGDTAQLPPVGKLLSPALDPDFLASFGLEVSEYELTQVVRQHDASGLLQNATLLRNALSDNKLQEFPRLKSNQHDVWRIQGDELIECLHQSIQEVGWDECRVVCRSNKRAILYNQGIRSRILYKEEELSTGDLLLVAKNNYYWSQQVPSMGFIANGDLIEVLRVRRQHELYGFRFADIVARFPESQVELEVRVLLDSLTAEAPALDRESQERLYQSVLADYADCRNRKTLYEQLRQDPWLNALQIKYGYAMTCHKAQGGQWKHVYIDQGWIDETALGADYYRWLYTALTRSTEKVFLVNFDERFL